MQSCGNELGRLAQGIRGIKGTDRISFIHHSDFPKDKKDSYARIVFSIKQSKKETHITRITAGGNVLQCDGNTSAPTADLATLKLLINSVVSTSKAKFMKLDIKNYYLRTTLAEKQCIFIQADTAPEKIIQAYKLQSKTHNNKKCMTIDKGMCRLKKAGALAYDDL